MAAKDNGTFNSPSHADTDAAADRLAFMKQAEKSLQDPRVRDYFLDHLVSHREVLQLLVKRKIFDEQAAERDSYQRYSAFRDRAARKQWRKHKVIYVMISFLRGRPIQQSRLRDLRERWLADVGESVIYPNVVEAINTLLSEKDPKKLRVERESQGLKRLQDPIFRVSTRSSDRLRELLSQMDGGSIALAGPRGAGKSTLLKIFSQLSGDQMISVGGICVYVPAPAEYIAKEFIADLFQRLCEAYLQYSQSTAAATLPGADGPSMSRGRKFRRMASLSWLTIRALLAVILVLWVAALLIKKAFPERPLSVGTLGHWIDHVQALTRTWWSADRWYFDVVIVLVVVLVALACWPHPRLWRRYMRRPEERELTKRAREYLLRLQVDKTVTKSASIAGPIIRGMTFGLNRGTSVKYIPWTMPELVGQARRFMEDMSAELRTLNRAIFIGIDEIDRIGSLEHAERFIGEIKAIFGIEGCFFMVAVAEDVGSMFAQRATAGRSIVENAFDEIVAVRPLDLAEARNLLVRRVPGFTDAFVYLVHALSEGLPRELIRVSRRLVEIRLEQAVLTKGPAKTYPAADGRGPTRTVNHAPDSSQLDYLAQALVREAVIEALDAARNQMSYLHLRSSWAAVFDAIRLASAALRRDDNSPEAVYLRIEQISQIHAEVRDSETSESEDIARRILDRLSALAYFGITVIDAFSDKYFNLDKVKQRTYHKLDGSYEELAAARGELSMSTVNSRTMLDRFRRSLRRDSTKWFRPHWANFSGHHQSRLANRSGPVPPGLSAARKRAFRSKLQLGLAPAGNAERSEDSRPRQTGGATSTWSGGPKNTWYKHLAEAGMTSMTADEPTPTSQLGRPRAERRPVRARHMPTKRRQTRWSRDWPPELEWKITPTHKHVAILIGPIFLVLFGLAAAVGLSTINAHGDGLRMGFIWLAWFVLFLRLIWKVSDWSLGYFFVASDRIILVSGILRRRTNAIWLAQVTAIDLKRSVAGVVFGYGELVFHSPCPDAAMVTFDYAPYPDQFFLELCELAFPKPENDHDNLVAGNLSFSSRNVVDLKGRPLAAISWRCRLQTARMRSTAE